MCAAHLLEVNENADCNRQSDQADRVADDVDFGADHDVQLVDGDDFPAGGVVCAVPSSVCLAESRCIL